MELTKGLYKDSRWNKLPKGAWVEARNILLSRGFKSVSDEDGFKFLHSSAYTPIIGVIPCADKIVYFTTGIDGIGSIFYVMNNNLDTPISLVIDSFLNFQQDHPIEGIFKVNNKGETIVVWTDNYNEIRYLNVDNPPNVITVNNILLSPNLTNPTIALDIIDNAGSVLVGNHSFVTRYYSDTEISSQWLDITRPLFITTSDIADGYNSFCGDKIGTISDKAIDIAITNIDTTFKFLELGVIQTVGQVKTFKSIVRLQISGTSLNFRYTGSEVYDDSIALEDVLINKVVYTRAKTLTEVDNKLYIGNLGTSTNFSYQKYANNIKIKYNTQNKQVLVLNNGSSKTKDLNHDDRGFLHREVYAFYIVFRLLKGGYSQAYHIPGRAMIAGEDAVSGLANTGFVTNPLVYEIEDTCGPIGGDQYMGYYHNKNEFYPSAPDDLNGDFEVWDSGGQIGSIQGENVRHHRFPSVAFISDSGVYTPSLYRISEADVLGIDISDVYIPDEIKEQIQGWEIFYAQRDYNNCTVLAQDFSIYAGKDDSTDYRYSTGVNYDFGETTGIGNPIVTTDRISNHYFNFLQSRNLDLITNKPSNTPNYIVNELQYTLAANRFRTRFNSGTSSWMYENIMIDLTSNFNPSDVVVAVVPSSGDSVRKVLGKLYVPYGSNDGIRNNYVSDEYMELEIDNSANFHVYDNGDFLYHGSVAVYGIPDMATNLYSMMFLKDNIYLEFNSYPQLVSSGVFVDKDEVAKAFIFGGDIFVVDHSTVRYGTVYTDPTLINVDSGAIGLNHCLRGILETVGNWSLRHLDTGTQSWYYPKKPSNPDDGVIPNCDTSFPLVYLYNKDFTAIDNLNSTFVYNYKSQQVSTFPYRIARSVTNNTDNNILGWGNFLANDWEDIDKSKGVVWRIQSYNGSLFINSEHSFYTALKKDKLATSIEEIYLGTSNIFDRKPLEPIVTPLGYAGCQSQWATVLCKHGYAFIDAETGKVFIFNGTIRELSNEGMHDWLFNNLATSTPTVDNPFTQNGLTCTFDEEFNRLIIGKRDYTWIGGEVQELSYELIVYQEGDLIFDGFTYYYATSIQPVDGEQYLQNSILIDDGLGGTLDGYAVRIDLDNTFYFTNNSFTLSYDFNNQCWVCNHDYYPHYMFYSRIGTFAIHNNLNGRSFKTNNRTLKGVYFDDTITYKSYIDVPFSFYKAVILSAVKWKSHILDNAGVFYENQTITHLMIYTQNQCSGIIDLLYMSPVRRSNTIFRELDGSWSCNDFRDLLLDKTLIFLDSKAELITDTTGNKAFYKKDKFLSDNFIVRFSHDNTVKTGHAESKILYLNEVDVLINESQADDK